MNWGKIGLNVATGGLPILNEKVGEVGKVVGGNVGGVIGAVGKAAPQNTYRGTPYEFSPEAFKEGYANQDSQALEGLSRVKDQGQGDFLAALKARAQGTGPSAAELQMQKGQEANFAQALAMANSSRGNVNPGLAQRTAQNALGNINAQTNLDQGILRAQEQAQAEQSYGQALAKNQEMVNQMTQYYLNLGFTAQQAENQALMELEKLKAGEVGRVDSVNSGVAAGNVAAQNQFAGAILGGAGDVGAAYAKGKG